MCVCVWWGGWLGLSDYILYVYIFLQFMGFSHVYRMEMSAGGGTFFVFISDTKSDFFFKDFFLAFVLFIIVTTVQERQEMSGERESGKEWQMTWVESGSPAWWPSALLLGHGRAKSEHF